MVELGLDICENPDSRKMALSMATSMKGKTWSVVMKMIQEAVTPAITRYKEIADNAPANYRELTSYMLKHEESMLEFAKLELAGDASTEVIHDQVKNRLPLK